MYLLVQSNQNKLYMDYSKWQAIALALHRRNYLGDLIGWWNTWLAGAFPRGSFTISINTPPIVYITISSSPKQDRRILQPFEYQERYFDIASIQCISLFFPPTFEIPEKCSNPAPRRGKTTQHEMNQSSQIKLSLYGLCLHILHLTARSESRSAGPFSMVRHVRYFHIHADIIRAFGSRTSNP